MSALPSLPPGVVAVERAGGTVHRRVERFAPDLLRGAYPVGALLREPMADLETLCGAAPCGAIENALFLDTETTGLAGGAGTFVFLIGVASFVGQEFEIRQWLLPDPCEEAALLDALFEEVGRARSIVSFHGRGFDVPRLDERCALSRHRSPFDGLPHADLLIGARRTFKLRARDTRLTTLEVDVLGVQRLDDLPGSECPEAWYDYLRGDPAPMARVLEHNLLDLLSLPALATAMCRAARGEGAASDLHAAGRVLARAGEEARGLDLQRRALASAAERDVLARAHEECARLLRRWGDLDAAAADALAATEADPMRPGPWLALAKYAEHRAKDFALALTCTDRLAQLAGMGLLGETATRDLVKRRARVEAKRDRAAAKRADAKRAAVG